MLPIEVNGPIVGIFLKELVRRAMAEIRNQRFSFEAMQKPGHDGAMSDVLTTADQKAQTLMVRLIQEALPGVGIIGEEDGLNVPCTIPKRDAYITIDPLDGTRAFVRGQSHGIATMLALVIDGEVRSAWIGDVNTFELYGYRPGSDAVHRITNLETAQPLHEVPQKHTVEGKVILLRSVPRGDVPATELAAVRRFRSALADTGSIGCWFTRLWKGEVAAVLLEPGVQTPWDTSPCIGISEKLGYVYLRATPDGTWEEFNPAITRETYECPHYTLVVHERMRDQFQ